MSCSPEISVPLLSESDCQCFSADLSSPSEAIVCTEEALNLLYCLGHQQNFRTWIKRLKQLHQFNGAFQFFYHKWKYSSKKEAVKAQTNADNPLNYRLISLLSVVSKVIEGHSYTIPLISLYEVTYPTILIAQAQLTLQLYAQTTCIIPLYLL